MKNSGQILPSTFIFDVFNKQRPIKDGSQIDEIICGLVKAMPHHKVGEYFSCKRSMFTTSDYIVAATTSSGETVSVLMAKWYETRHKESFLNLETLLVAEQLHRTLIVRKLLTTLFRVVIQESGLFPDFITMKTYTPKSYNIMNMFSRSNIQGVRMYPLINNGRAQPEDLMMMAQRVAEEISPGLKFDKERGIIHGASGQVPDDFWPAFPSARRDDINEYFKMNVTAKDRMLCLLVAKEKSAKIGIMNILGISS